MTTEPLDIDVDLSHVTTTIPLIKHGHIGRVRLINISGVKDDTGKTKSIKWEFRMLEPSPQQDMHGNDIEALVPANHPLIVNFNLDFEFTQQKMAKFLDAILGTGDRGNTSGKPERPRLNSQTIASLIGREAIAKVSVAKSKKTDYVGNDIDRLTPIGE